MNKYEIMFIVKTNLDNDTVKSLTDDLQSVFTSNKESKVVDFKDMGQRTLAYPIKKEVNGFYFLLTVETVAECLNEFNHKISINENVLRHLVVKLDEE